MIAKRSGPNNGFFGKHHTEKAIQRNREAHTGVTASETTRKKMSLKRKNVPFTQSHCDHIAASLRGKTKSPTHCANLSIAHKGLQVGKKHPMFNHQYTEETLQKMRDAKKGIYEGSGNPAWKGGISFEPYCPKFNDEFRERVRKFFGHTCQLCGHVWQPGERRLSVHHVNYDKNACCEQSVIPLFVPVCSGKCHGKTNRNRKDWESYFTELIMTKYGGQCYLPKEVMTCDK